MFKQSWSAWSAAALSLTVLAGFAHAKEPVAFQGVARIEPVKVAQARLVDGQVWIVGEWMNYVGGSRVAAPGAEAFDVFEPDENGVPTDVDPGCGLSGARWFFGGSYCSGVATRDMTVEPGFEGVESTTNNFAWSGGCAEGMAFVVALFTGETWEDCDGFGGAYDGVAYDFGDLCDGSGPSYANNNLEGTELFHQLPFDGAGWYQMRLLNKDDQGNLFPAVCAQPLLWGPGENRPGSTGPNQWDDDDPKDGAYQENECYDYAFGLCPDPLAAMVSFGVGGDGCDEHQNCNGDEKALKAKCAVKDGAVKKAVVKFKGATPDAEYAVELDGGQCASGTAKSNGKVKVTFKGDDAPPCGSNTATVCGLSEAFDCDC